MLAWFWAIAYASLGAFCQTIDTTNQHSSLSLLSFPLFYYRVAHKPLVELSPLQNARAKEISR